MPGQRIVICFRNIAAALLVVLAFSSFGWGACHEVGVRVGGCNENPATNDACHSYGSSYPYCVNTGISCNNTSMCGAAGIPIWCATYMYCTTQAELDSANCLRSGNLWINGVCRDEQWVCENDGGHWVNGECQPPCNDHVSMPDKCEEIWKSGYNVDGDGNPGGGGYWAITTYECYYDSCAMSLNCQEKSSFPAGNLTCSDFQDTTGTNGRCAGVVGPNCIIQSE